MTQLRAWLLPAATVVVAALFLLPAGYLLVATVGSGALIESLTSTTIWVPLFNSLSLGVAVTIGAAVLGTVSAVLVARTDMFGRTVFRLLFALPLVVPSYVGATAVLAATGRGGLVSWLPQPTGFIGSFLVLTAFTYPYVYLLVLARLSSLPTATEESALLLSSSRTRLVSRVLMPQLYGAIAAGSLLVFLYTISDFGAVSLMRFDTLTRVIYSARLLDSQLSLTMGLVLAVIALIVAWVMRLLPVSPPAGGRGRRSVTMPLGRARYAFAAGAAVLLFFILAVPLAVFVSWVVRGEATIGAGFGGLGDELGFLGAPLLGSVGASVTAGLVAVVVTFPVAYGLIRRSSVGYRSAAAVVAATFALPGLVIALALVSWAVNAPGIVGALYQTFPLLILAYVIHFGAQSLQATQSAFGAVTTNVLDAARLLGASASRRLRTIELPLLVPGLLVAVGLVMLSTMKELPATLLLAPIGFETLATVIWGAAEDGFFAEVGITSLVLVVLSGVLTWALVLRRELAR